MEKYLTSKVFTPTTPAELTFIEREEINEKLVDALNQPGMQLIVYGHSGSGKTTLLRNKLNQLYENHLTSRCSENISINQLVLDAFDQLDRYYTSKIEAKRSNKTFGQFSADFFQIRTVLRHQRETESKNTLERILPPQLTIQRLAEFIGAAEMCWVVEDFHKVKPEEKKELSDNIKNFVDISADYPKLKIITIGAVGSAGEVISLSGDLYTRVSEIHVPLMKNSELTEIIDKGADLLNLNIKPHIQQKIVRLSNGLAAVCHQLCLNLCNLNKITETYVNYKFLDTKEYHPFTFNDDHLKQAVNKYVDEQSESFKWILDNAILEKDSSKYENCKLILVALSRFLNEQVSPNEILTEIRKLVPKYPASNLTKYIKLLTSDSKYEILRFDSKARKYQFSNPFLKVYTQMKFDRDVLKKEYKSLFQVGGLELLIAKNPDNFDVDLISIGDSLEKINWLMLSAELRILYVELKKRSVDFNEFRLTDYVSFVLKDIENGKKSKGLEVLLRSENWIVEVAEELKLEQIMVIFNLRDTY